VKEEGIECIFTGIFEKQIKFWDSAPTFCSECRISKKVTITAHKISCMGVKFGLVPWNDVDYGCSRMWT
jgi:hypothetical protein